MGQVIPTVSERDVERIAVRDFGRARLAEVLDVLHEYGRREGTRGAGSPRVHLAILKIADGDFAALQKYTGIAISDFRDVVGAAEYPFPHLWVRNPDDPDREDTDDQANWKQYQAWLERK